MEMFCFENVKMKSLWVRVGPESTDWCLCTKRGHTETRTQGRWPHDNGGRDWGHLGTRPKMSRIARHHQKLGRGKEEFYPRVFRGSFLVDTLNLVSSL